MLQSLLEELLPPLASLLAEDASGRTALCADGALPWEPLARCRASLMETAFVDMHVFCENNAA